MRIAIPVLAATAALSGCLSDLGYNPWTEGNEAYAPFSSFSNFTNDDIQLVRGHLSGDIGPMRGMDGPAQLNGYHDTEFTSIEVIVANDRGAAMALLDLHGGVNHPAIRPGAEFVFTRDQLPDADGAFFVTGLGCAGNGPVGDWDFDRPLEEVQLRVDETENPDVMRLNFTTRTRSDESFGYVDVAIRE